MTLNLWKLIDWKSKGITVCVALVSLLLDHCSLPA
jgi:hypothetical protein